MKPMKREETPQERQRRVRERSLTAIGRGGVPRAKDRAGATTDLRAKKLSSARNPHRNLPGYRAAIASLFDGGSWYPGGSCASASSSIHSLLLRLHVGFDSDVELSTPWLSRSLIIGAEFTITKTQTHHHVLGRRGPSDQGHKGFKQTSRSILHTLHKPRGERRRRRQKLRSR